MDSQRQNLREDLFPVAHIEKMVHTFYARVREDAELGPIFERRVEDWPVHLGRMVLFWRAVLRSEPTFTASMRGAPPVLHWQMEELRSHHFERWLVLFGSVADGVYTPEAASRVKAAAARIARVLSRHVEPDAPPGTPTPPAGSMR